MNNRIPAYFELSQYHISPEEVVRGTLHCEPGVVQSKVIVTPWWKIGVFSAPVEEFTEIVAEEVYQLHYQGQPFTLVRSGIGAPQTGDVLLALGNTPCQEVIFTGSVGGLCNDMQIGDLVIARKAISGDGFSRYLDTQIRPADLFFQVVEPDRDLTDQLEACAVEMCRPRAVPLHSGIIFSTDSILAQFCRLDYLVQQWRCQGIEMETAAVFQVAKLLGIRASALLQISDVPLLGKSVYAGRTEQDLARRKTIRSEVLVKIILDTLLTT